mmetsp:Transcript_15562/g.48923  ORF Transcript_15562/g.48923 Transcript_15562/m.48923 type:complete len:218 (-) Transcript_15562:307-960(-)
MWRPAPHACLSHPASLGLSGLSSQPSPRGCCALLHTSGRRRRRRQRLRPGRPGPGPGPGHCRQPRALARLPQAWPLTEGRGPPLGAARLHPQPPPSAAPLAAAASPAALLVRAPGRPWGEVPGRPCRAGAAAAHRCRPEAPRERRSPRAPGRRGAAGPWQLEPHSPSWQKPPGGSPRWDCLAGFVERASPPPPAASRSPPRRPGRRRRGPRTRAGRA